MDRLVAASERHLTSRACSSMNSALRSSLAASAIVFALELDALGEAVAILAPRAPGATGICNPIRTFLWLLRSSFAASAERYFIHVAYMGEFLAQLRSSLAADGERDACSSCCTGS